MHFWHETVKILPSFTQRIIERHNVSGKLVNSLCRMGIPCKFCDDFWRPIPK